jgi:hypothetical protein
MLHSPPAVRPCRVHGRRGLWLGVVTQPLGRDPVRAGPQALTQVQCLLRLLDLPVDPAKMTARVLLPDAFNLRIGVMKSAAVFTLAGTAFCASLMPLWSDEPIGTQEDRQAVLENLEETVRSINKRDIAANRGGHELSPA